MTNTILDHFTQASYGKSLGACSNEEIYRALFLLVKQRQTQCKPTTGKKKLYYISAEFLIGKLLSNNLINLGLYDTVKEELAAAGKSLAEIEEMEPEPSLGNGGLGRLAACFLDSIATLGLPGAGVGLNYHNGLFRQTFSANKQYENPNPWIKSQSWLEKTDTHFTVPFKDFTLRSTLYNITVTGYEKQNNPLHLFDVDTVDSDIIQDGIQFDKTDIAHNLTLFLYPDDSDRAGQLLRIYQQYFMVSNAAQLILKELDDKGLSVLELDKHVVVQINDTHPALVIPELIRLLLERGVSMDDSIRLVTHTCAYTNHTILAEALEKWPLNDLEEVVPHLLPILHELDQRAKAQYSSPEVALIDAENRVHMARMAIHYGFSVNGVAALHTDILKSAELHPFYEIYPDKFNNKTNGITFRRWLMACNPKLATYITELIGEGWKKDARELEKLLAFVDDDAVLKRMTAIKAENKQALADFIRQTSGETIHPNSIYDIQIKRLHEYKRQQMNALYIIWKYKQIKAGNVPKRPITLLFGAKAAPAYILAKDIIHLILCLQQLINNDPDVSPHLKVVMVENYNVTKAEKLIPACDVSEQISLASKEASGTGNMKFMLNGAITLGTMDGANVEICELVGKENIAIFGQSSDSVIKLYETQGYCSEEYYKDPEIAPLVDFIIGKELIEIGDPENLCRLYKDIRSKDWFMALLDLKDYIQTKEALFQSYEDQKEWAKRTLVNTAKAGFFSSDRTIAQYNSDIWKLK